MTRHNNAVFLKNVTIKGVSKIISELDINDNDAVAILIAEKCVIDVEDLISFLNKNNIVFFGGVFPGVIYENQRLDEGAVIFTLPVVNYPYLIKNISDCDCEGLSELEKNTSESDKKYTVFALVDGLASNIACFIRCIYNKLGNSVNYFGGGAGYLDLKQRPCIFSNEGFYKDAAIIVLVKMQSCLGVRHGWKAFNGPVVATKTDGNRVIELNWKNAFAVYKDIILNNGEVDLNKNNFFDVAKKYPFGMLKENYDYIVRDTVSVNRDGELICVGEVPENSVLDILKGNKNSLIEAAEQAVNDCLKSKDQNIEMSFVVDCISRVLFLENEFQQELKVIQNSIKTNDPDIKLIGVLSLGEISSYGDDLIDFFNKTIVVGVLYE